MINFIRRLFYAPPTPKALPAPTVATPDKAVEEPIRSQSSHEALSNSADRIPIYAMHPHPQTPRALRNLVNANKRNKLSAMARYCVENGGPAAYAVGLIKTHSVPLSAQSVADDPDYRNELEDYWSKWCKVADFRGKFTMDQLQKVACVAIDEDGDIGWAMVDDNGEPRIRTFECWLIGDPLDVTNTIDGVRVNAEEQILGYEVFHPDGKKHFYSKDGFKLLYDPTRDADLRGSSALRAGMNDHRDAQEIKQFTKLGVKVNAALVGTLETASGITEENVWGNDTGVAGQDAAVSGLPPGGEGSNVSTTATPQQRKMSLAELLGGDIPVLPIGEKLNVIPQDRTGGAAMEFTEMLNAHFVSGLQFPPAFFQDAKLTGPNIRSVIGKAQRKFDDRADVFEEVMTWVWIRVISHGIATGRISARPGWDKVRWQRRPKLTIDLGDQMKEEREMVLGGQMSRQRYHSNAAHDWQTEEVQIFSEDDFIIQKAKQQASATGIPIETILARHGFQFAPQKQPDTGANGQPANGGAKASAIDIESFANEDLEDVAFRPNQPRDENGKWTKGGAPKTRAERAKSTHKPSTGEKQQRAAAEQDRFAKAIKGENTDAVKRTNSPFDVKKGKHVFEFKTILDNGNDKITMHKESRLRKLRAAKREQKKAHTVAVDIRDGKRTYYYRSGLGSFRISGMTEVTLAYLKSIFAQ